jgi:aspartyl-tRNA(Asn)/glutamyl-tRNA(Gln) amidotransferase subunit A
VVSARGVTPLSRRLDHVGVLARSAADAAALLDVLAGFDPDCPESRAAPRGERVAPAVAGATIGVVREFAAPAVEPAVAGAFAAALEVLQGLGCRIAGIELGGYDAGKARRAGLLAVEAEAAVVHDAHRQAAPEEFSPALRRMLDYGRNAGAPQLVRAWWRIAEAGAALRCQFRAVDIIATPTTPQPAFPFDAPVPANQADLTALANFAGCPAISMPMGCDPSGLPLGLQLIAAPFEEARLLALADAYESAAGHRMLPPPPFGAATS